VAVSLFLCCGCVLFFFFSFLVTLCDVVCLSFVVLIRVRLLFVFLKVLFPNKQKQLSRMDFYRDQGQLSAAEVGNYGIRGETLRNFLICCCCFLFFLNIFCYKTGKGDRRTLQTPASDIWRVQVSFVVFAFWLWHFPFWANDWQRILERISGNSHRLRK
jgi:hypothetical protein